MFENLFEDTENLCPNLPSEPILEQLENFEQNTNSAPLHLWLSLSEKFEMRSNNNYSFYLIESATEEWIRGSRRGMGLVQSCVCLDLISDFLGDL